MRNIESQGRRLEAAVATMPELARDIRLNLETVLEEDSLSPAQRWGVAVACAAASRNEEFRVAVIEAARLVVADAVVEDGLAAAAMMAMNNVFLRFRKLAGNPAYHAMAPRLRMDRLLKPATNKMDLELFSLAVSAVNGCELCIRAHEKDLLEGGMTPEQIHDAVRIASSVQATAVALELAEWHAQA